MRTTIAECAVARLVLTEEDTRPGRAYNRVLTWWRFEDQARDQTTHGPYKRRFDALADASAAIGMPMRSCDWQIREGQLHAQKEGR